LFSKDTFRLQANAYGGWSLIEAGADRALLLGVVPPRNWRPPRQRRRWRRHGVAGTVCMGLAPTATASPPMATTCPSALTRSQCLCEVYARSPARPALSRAVGPFRPPRAQVTQPWERLDSRGVCTHQWRHLRWVRGSGAARAAAYSARPVSEGPSSTLRHAFAVPLPANPAARTP